MRIGKGCARVDVAWRNARDQDGSNHCEVVQDLHAGGIGAEIHCRNGRLKHQLVYPARAHHQNEAAPEQHAGSNQFACLGRVPGEVAVGYANEVVAGEQHCRNNGLERKRGYVACDLVDARSEQATDEDRLDHQRSKTEQRVWSIVGMRLHPGDHHAKWFPQQDRNA